MNKISKYDLLTLKALNFVNENLGGKIFHFEIIINVLLHVALSDSFEYLCWLYYESTAIRNTVNLTVR